MTAPSLVEQQALDAGAEADVDAELRGAVGDRHDQPLVPAAQAAHRLAPRHVVRALRMRLVRAHR